MLLRAYRSENPPFMVLFDEINLETLRNAPVIICDATFEYCPSECYDATFEVDGEKFSMSGQTYTIHAVYSDLPNFQTSFLCGRFSICYSIFLLILFSHCIYAIQND